MIRKWNWSWSGFGKRGGRSRRENRPRAVSRFLLIESLEPRQLLSGSPLVDMTASAAEVAPPLDAVDRLLERLTPQLHPAGHRHTASESTAAEQVVKLDSYNPRPLPSLPANVPELQKLRDGLEKIQSDIRNNPDARPAIWGETTVMGGGEYRLHLDDNGMLVGAWSIDWGDGTQPQLVHGQPWVVHRYANHSAVYRITAQANGGAYSIHVSQLSDGPDLAAGTGSLDVASSPDAPADLIFAVGGESFALTSSEAPIGESSAPGEYALAADTPSPAGLEVTVENVPPVLRVVGDQTVNAGQLWSVPDFAVVTADAFTYSIDWGDGTDASSGSVEDEDGFVWPQAFGGEHAYDRPGTYYVTAAVTDGDSNSDAQTFRMTVLDAGVALTSFYTDGDALKVTYTITSSQGYAAPFTIGIYSTTDGQTPGTLLASIPVTDDQSLQAGSQHELVVIPDLEEVDGDYSLLAVTDGDVTTSNNSWPLTSGAFNSQDSIVHVFGSGSGDQISISPSSIDGTLGATQLSYPLSSGISEVHVQASAGDDTIDASTATATLVAYGGPGNDTITGSDRDDLLYGDAGNDTIDGGPGDDVIYGGGGLNTIRGGAGDDLVYAEGDGGSLVDGDGGNDTLYAGDHGDTLHGDNGNDEVYGGAGNDHLYGDEGNDWIEGGSGNGILRGDPLFGTGKDWLICGTGDDEAYGGGDGDAVIIGGPGNDLLSAGFGTNEIHTGTGTNCIESGGLDDILDGTLGTSTIWTSLCAGSVRVQTPLWDYGLEDWGRSGMPNPDGPSMEVGQAIYAGEEASGLAWDFPCVDSLARLGEEDATQVAVYVFWNPDDFTPGEWTSDAHYSVYDGASLKATVEVNQQNPCPSDSPDPSDHPWKLLGVYNITSGIVDVRLHDGNNNPPFWETLNFNDVMIRPIWPTMTIRADQNNDRTCDVKDDWLNSWSPAAIAVEGQGKRTKIELHATIDQLYQYPADWTASLSNVDGLLFWDTDEGGTALTPANGKIVSGTFPYDRTLWISLDPNDVPSGTVQVSFAADGPSGGHVEKPLAAKNDVSRTAIQVYEPTDRVKPADIITDAMIVQHDNKTFLRVQVEKGPGLVNWNLGVLSGFHVDQDSAQGAVRWMDRKDGNDVGPPKTNAVAPFDRWKPVSDEDGYVEFGKASRWMYDDGKEYERESPEVDVPKMWHDFEIPSGANYGDVVLVFTDVLNGTRSRARASGPSQFGDLPAVIGSWEANKRNGRWTITARRNEITPAVRQPEQGKATGYPTKGAIDKAVRETTGIIKRLGFNLPWRIGQNKTDTGYDIDTRQQDNDYKAWAKGK